MSAKWWLGRGTMLVVAAMLGAAPAQAYLFWTPPALAHDPVVGDPTGITLKLDGATPAEQQASLVWTMRAGLNVAALQCQFAPQLQTVSNYNNMLHQHAVELQKAYAALSAYFKRTAPKTWMTALDQYTTRTYNSFSTLNAQVIFCETASAVGRETLNRPRGQLAAIAAERMREFRASLTPVGDAAFVSTAQAIAPPEVEFTPECVDRKGRPTKCKG